ncbi:MAG: hypothetical protein JW816_03675 [Candidatus Buchananbacteria bacterium]|nr:hypothetical protein [Candidatus Buchananbacteria bacterium]
MYLYLYDSFLNQKKYNNQLARIETRLTDLGINGKISRLSPLRNIQELLADELRNGVKTVVVVGNDKTLNEVINIAAKFDVIFGLIPVGGENHIASSLGIPIGEEACNIISGRIIKKLDLGKINNTYFLSDIKIAGDQVTIECEDHYKIMPQASQSEISICNFKPALAGSFNQNGYFNPQDGLLEIFIQPIVSGMSKFFKKPIMAQSIIPIRKIAIDSKQSVSVITDGQKVLKTPVKIEIVPKKLKLIVGKSREF